MIMFHVNLQGCSFREGINQQTVKLSWSPYMPNHLWQQKYHHGVAAKMFAQLSHYPYHPWDERYIHLHEWLIFMVDVGKYTVHGWYGLYNRDR